MFARCPADATATPTPHNLLPRLNTDWLNGCSSSSSWLFVGFCNHIWLHWLKISTFESSCMYQIFTIFVIQVRVAKLIAYNFLEIFIAIIFYAYSCWFGVRKGIRPVETEWWGAGVVICQQGAQLMPLPLTVSCFSKIQIGFTFLVPAHLGSPGKRAVKCVCVCLYVLVLQGSILNSTICMSTEDENDCLRD